MTDLILQYLTFAMQGPQEFCIACVPIGLAGMFTGRLPARKYPIKSTKRTNPKKRNTRKFKKSKPQKQPQSQSKTWYTAPPMSPHQHIEYARYWAKSRGVKGEWVAGIPI